MIDLSKYQAQWVAISQINAQNKMFQFRKEITAESVANLAKSLAESGQKFPIVIWLRNSGEHVPVSGLRRIAAAQSLNWEKILAVTIPESEADEEEVLGLNFIENIKRKTLTNLDIMFACKRLSDEGKSNVKIGGLIGKNEKQVRRYIAIAEAPKEKQDALAKGDITIDQASRPGVGLESEGQKDNEKYIVKSTKNGIDTKMKIEATIENEATVNAYIADIKKAWKQALKKYQSAARKAAKRAAGKSEPSSFKRSHASFATTPTGKRRG